MGKTCVEPTINECRHCYLAIVITLIEVIVAINHSSHQCLVIQNGVGSPVAAHERGVDRLLVGGVVPQAAGLWDVGARDAGKVGVELEGRKGKLW